MPEGRRYSIRKNRIQKSLNSGFLLTEDGTLQCQPNMENRFLFLDPIDSGGEDGKWGRLSFESDFSEDLICVIHAFAYNHSEFVRRGEVMQLRDFILKEEESIASKKRFFEAFKEVKFVNENDILLYELTGRYLWIFIEVIGRGTGEIRNLKIDLLGDDFLDVFPEIYNGHNSFFHRYISIFSSIYNDFQQEIERIPRKLDIDTAPAEVLPIFAGWFGIDVSGGFLEEKKLRLLVKEAYELNKGKGSKRTLERLTEILLGEKAIIVENSRVREHSGKITKEILDNLFGESPYDVTIMIHTEVMQNQKRQLLFLLNQFKPIRAHLKLVILMGNGFLDSYCYLDVNAKIYDIREANLDKDCSIDGTVILQ